MGAPLEEPLGNIGGGSGEYAAKDWRDDVESARSTTLTEVDAESGCQMRGLSSEPSQRTAEIDEALFLKIRAFSDQREDERKRAFNLVVRLFFWLLILSGVSAAAGNALIIALPGSPFSGLILVLAYGLFSCSVVIGSLCPADLLDVNDFCRKNRKKVAIGWVGFGLLALTHAPAFPHVDLLEALICICGIASGWAHVLPPWWPLTSTWVACTSVIDGISWGPKYIIGKYAQVETLPPFTYAIGCFALLWATLSFVLWRWRLRQLSRSGEAVAGASIACYEVLYRNCTGLGVYFVLRGIGLIIRPREGQVSPTTTGALLIARGVCALIPGVVVMLMGRQWLFQMMGRSFDADGERLRRDGAFVAELLENVSVRVGQIWWVHREDNNLQVSDNDPRRHWRQGFVVEVTPDSPEFVVQLPSPEAGSGGTKLRLQHPSAGVGKSQEDLLIQAQQSLRCIEFQKMSPELMRRHDSCVPREQQAAWFALSRPVREGETIDYFLSNSWYDDAEKKWKRLTEVAERFYKANGRYPTFWLDKACIEQNAIIDSLKVLPVNVMACRKLLALCGDTYFSRLWCLWELFTLFAFMNEAAALDRVEFIFLGGREEGLQLLQGMASFHVRNAHCYDPNEEARLRRVIDAVGRTRFNRRIASMGAGARARLEQDDRRNLFSKSLSVTTWTTKSSRSSGTQSAAVKQDDRRNLFSKSLSVTTWTTKSSRSSGTEFAAAKETDISPA